VVNVVYQFLQNTSWATFFAIFPQTHLVTLVNQIEFVIFVIAQNKAHPIL
jgi:hypothetical protein